ncbi:SusC/RagA family TonB-linked outer membrane protein [Flavicella marina]|uniref:SusC/RagA family TonB-linked outer membrane protein n=1 Tax=Flavicella marina TaxID=1475951 RepID=UPI001265A45D|nr:TonB-dependent receptor [Flavicella marina]
MKKLFFLKKGQVLLLLAFFSLLSIETNAQQGSGSITGVVVSQEDNMPIPGVTVIVKGTAVGTTTNFDGEFTISANQGDTLEFTFIGMTTQTLKVNGATANVSLSPDVEDLEEVVVIGYGAQKKKEVTGAVSQVKAEAIEDFVAPDVANSLQGMVAGVNVTAASGEPGESSNIQIRGITSLSGSNTPLFVVDGIPQQGDPGLAPNEIETIDILKDAASAAVYGTRGAAGVILITTKRGTAGNVRVSFDTSYGVQSLGTGTPLMNTDERLRYDLQKYNLVSSQFPPGPHNNPEWLNNDNEFRDYVLVDYAGTTQHNLNITGGTDSFTYNAVVGYFNQEGTIINSGYKKLNGRATTTYKSDKWKINTSLAFTLDDKDVVSSGLLITAMKYPPYYPQIDPDAEIIVSNGSGGVTTPANNLAQALKRKTNRRQDKINGSLSLSYNFTPDFYFITRAGVNVNNILNHQFVPKFGVFDIEDNTTEVDPIKSWVINQHSRFNSISWDGSLNYKKKIGGHTFNLLASATLLEEHFEDFTARKEGVANNSIEVLNGANINPNATSGFNYNVRTIGFLGRLQYNYQGKYLLSALIRRDGSSKFGSSNRWGTFPSVSAGWNMSSEDFWSSIKPVVNNLKIRASIGTVGNDSFPAYEYAATIQQGADYIFDETDTQVDFGTAIYSYANENVKWETSVQQNLGVDVSFLRNKFSLTADFYNTQKKDMLFPVRLPASSGAYYDTTTTLNIGDMTNRGMELAANYQQNFGKSRLRVGATFTKNSNKITKMQDGQPLIYNSNSTLISGDQNSVTTVLAEGYEVGSFFLFKTDGVIQTQEELDEYKQLGGRENARLGDLKYIDHNGDGVINEADRQYLGSALPDFEMGFNSTFSYKSWDLVMNWYGTFGSEILNGNNAAAFTNGAHKGLTGMWTPDNPTSNIPLHTGDSKSGLYNYTGVTDQWLESGDYVRLKLISLGYSFSPGLCERIGLTKLRLYMQAQNALTFTKYKGYDPEVGGGNVARRGLDVSRYPVSALYTMGLKLTF